ncbi:DUF998 domain-containing protein [Thermococcus sp. GR7]|uniref:DUF998 domain-containing protein n=1 Tax=unclassified Thermococcus TaxID=2627626 RepID=UPI001431C8BA|nr:MULTISPECIES: DUF998 domain-containing protein [unclassified Thermococcus]NJE47754.1 DUF998 domain-containing protein [Thermococcus sp. GR7]NJE78726.1 DUF998 domain-containing protein [Thermococcus sp. GR4]NJF22390.1 DUF998 domain-containing protein [Thermococcus sp. GR5]
MESTKLPAYISLLLPLVFLVGLIVVIYQNPWFSFTDNALSDMGSVRNPVNYYFNGFIMLFAVLGFIASLGAFKNGLSYLMPTAMVSLFLVGIFPEEYSLHTPSATLFYVLALADIVLIGLKLARSGLSVGMLWAILSVVTFVVMLYMVKARVFKGLAIPELIGAAMILAWFTYIGLLQIRGSQL